MMQERMQSGQQKRVQMQMMVLHRITRKDGLLTHMKAILRLWSFIMEEPYKMWTVQVRDLPQCNHIQKTLHLLVRMPYLMEWKGSSRTEATDWHVWNTSEFGYTSEMVMGQTRNVDLVIKKKDETTGEALKGAEFTVYKMQGGQWVTYTKATWNDQYKEYMALNLKETDTENRSFKVVETKNPAGYTGTWEHEFTAEKEGVVTFNTGCDKCQKNRSDHNHKNR